jgi:DNA-binding MarR family transcriptional regulator
MAGDGNMSDDEPDLGALMARVLPHLAALEEPILREAGLSMWEYAIVTELASNPVVSQAELSRRTRRDRTRLGRHLDDLASREIITRERSSDQRQRAVRLTSKGRTLYEKVKKSIRTVEDEFLHSTLSSKDAAQLRHLLRRLSAH